MLVILLSAGAVLLLSHFSTPRLRVERDKLVIDTVRRGTFVEYVISEAKVSPGPKGGLSAVVDLFEARRLAKVRGIEVGIGGLAHTLEILRIDPAGSLDAEVHLRFTGEPPAIASGQRLDVRFILGDPVEAVLLGRGAFFQATGGHWAWVVDEAEGIAVKREIRLGRQNPEDYEVLAGLAPGERVITSAYDQLDGAEELVLTQE